MDGFLEGPGSPEATWTDETAGILNDRDGVNFRETLHFLVGKQGVAFRERGAPPKTYFF